MEEKIHKTQIVNEMSCIFEAKTWKVLEDPFKLYMEK